MGRWLRLTGTSLCFTPGFYLHPQLLTRAAVMSFPAHLDVVSRDIGTVMRKEIVLMALTNLPLAVREQASVTSITMWLEKLCHYFQIQTRIMAAHSLHALLLLSAKRMKPLSRQSLKTC